MKKQIDAQDLVQDMYIVELDRPWLDSPFMFQGFAVQSQDEIDQVQKLCKYVYIDTELGLDISKKQDPSGAESRAAALKRQSEKINEEFIKLYDAPLKSFSNRKPYQEQRSLEEEIVVAKEIESNAQTLIQESFEDIEHGKDIDLVKAKEVVSKMADSVMRNPDALVCLSQLKDISTYTALHSIRTCTLALAFGRHLVLSKEEIKELGLGAFFHDIGMAQISHEIINKPTALTDQEYAIMQTHVTLGATKLEALSFPANAIDVVLQHHERHDGSGYPHQLKDKQISPFGAVGAIIDVYDALTSKTVYREGLSAEEALKRMYEWRHKDFNARLMEEFIKCMGIFPIGSLVELNNGVIGVVITINRARRLKPKVALVLNADKIPYTRKVIADLSIAKDKKVGEVKIKRVLPAGTHNINPVDHIVLL